MSKDDKLRKSSREFTGNPVVRTLCFHWPRVQSLVTELRAQMLHGVAKKKRNIS